MSRTHTICEGSYCVGMVRESIFLSSGWVRRGVDGAGGGTREADPWEAGARGLEHLRIRCI